MASPILQTPNYMDAKTRGIKLLKNTSSQHNNKEFTKRLSIPSVHVADQILIDILNEHGMNNGMNMNVIQEDEDDEMDIDILEFMDDEEDDYEDTDLDSVMTLDAFPDLPDFGHTIDPNTSIGGDTLVFDDIDSQRNTLIARITNNTQSEYTPRLMDEEEEDTYRDEDDEEDSFEDEDDDESLTPRTYARLFNDFHHTDEKKEDLPSAPKSPTPPEYSLSTKQLQLNTPRFSRLQRPALFHKLIEDESSMTSHDDDKTANNLLPGTGNNKRKLSSAESAILVAKELLETEILYQNHLKNLRNILLRPIISTYFGNECISSQFYGLLCSIISVSKSFTARLSIYVSALQIPQLANWIYFNCKRFGVYAHYAKMYDIFMDRLKLCMDIDDNIKFWIRRQEKAYKPELENQRLESLLFIPIQRVPQYILLLEELIKYTQRIDLESNAHDAGTILFLELAKSEVQTVSQRVNEIVRQRENRSNLTELMNRFCGAAASQLLRSNRVLVYEGFMYKVRKYKIKYYFHLFSDCITYSNINNNGLFNIHRVIYLDKVAIIDLPNVDGNVKKKKSSAIKKIWYRFLLKSQQKSFEILTENEQEKQNWTLLIRAAISRLNPQIKQVDESPQIRTQTMRGRETLDDEECYAPHWVPDDASSECMLCRSQFTLLNMRHHCRRCGRLVCKQCSKTKRLLMNIDKNKAVRICDDCVEETNVAQSIVDPSPSNNNNKHEEINAPRLSELFPDTSSPVKSDDIPQQILKYTREYKGRMLVLLEHFCRPIMDVVENNKIICDLITNKKFYNEANMTTTEEKEKKKLKKKQNKKESASKKRKKKLRAKKRASVLAKHDRATFSTSDENAARILSALYKVKYGHKTLIALCTIVEQIYDMMCLLHSELKLIIFKKHVNYEDDMILDCFSDADQARIGRLFILYTDLFNMHVEYASRFPECYQMMIGNTNSKENHLCDFVQDCELSLVTLNHDFILKDLLQSPLDFTRKMYQFLMKIRRKIDSSLVNSSDLNLCIDTSKQTLIDLDREKSQSQERIKLYKLQRSFDFSVDFRQRGRTLIIADFIGKFYFHLFSNILCVSTKKLANSSRFVYRKYVYLRDITSITFASTKKQSKKKKKYSITIKYCTNVAVFDRLNRYKEETMDAIHEEESKQQQQPTMQEETLSLMFENHGKKKIWLELINNLVQEERQKYRKNPSKKEKVGTSFCGICHSSFNPLYNMAFDCCQCGLAICDACCCDHVYLENKFRVPIYIKLCIRCNDHQHTQRSCNILCV